LDPIRITSWNRGGCKVHVGGRATFVTDRFLLVVDTHRASQRGITSQGDRQSAMDDTTDVVIDDCVDSNYILTKLQWAPPSHEAMVQHGVAPAYGGHPVPLRRSDRVDTFSDVSAQRRHTFCVPLVLELLRPRILARAGRWDAFEVHWVLDGPIGTIRKLRKGLTSH
jgi:hypothetical protein